MATFTNFATLSYSGGITNSNTVTGELLETLAVTKTAVTDNYTAQDNITYIITLINSGTTPLTTSLLAMIWVLTPLWKAPSIPWHIPKIPCATM